MKIKFKLLITMAVFAVSICGFASLAGAVPPDQSVLTEAIRLHDNKKVTSLLDNGVSNASVENEDHETPLNAAVRAGDKDIVANLVAHGADVNAPGKYGLLPLHVAALMNNYDVFIYLAEHGADIHVADVAGGNTPLHFAIIGESKEIFEYLISHLHDSMYLNSDNISRETPLHLALTLSSDMFACTLISNGARIDSIALKLSEDPVYKKSRVTKALNDRLDKKPMPLQSD